MALSRLFKGRAPCSIATLSQGTLLHCYTVSGHLAPLLHCLRAPCSIATLSQGTLLYCYTVSGHLAPLLHCLRAPCSIATLTLAVLRFPEGGRIPGSAGQVPAGGADQRVGHRGQHHVPLARPPGLPHAEGCGRRLHALAGLPAGTDPGVHLVLVC